MKARLMSDNLYELLGVHPNSPMHVVKDTIAYLENTGTLSSSQLQKAKTTLLNPAKREQYNQSLFSQYNQPMEASTHPRRSTYEIPSEPEISAPEAAHFSERQTINININNPQDMDSRFSRGMHQYRIKSQILTDEQYNFPTKIPSFVREALLRSEKVLYTAQPAYLSQFWLFVLAFLFLNTIFISAILVSIGIFNTVTTTLVLTDIRILATNAWLPSAKDNTQKKYLDLPINKIDSIEVQQGSWGQIFKYGAIEICDIYGTRTLIKRIKEPHKVKKDILNLLYYGE